MYPHDNTHTSKPHPLTSGHPHPSRKENTDQLPSFTFTLAPPTQTTQDTVSVETLSYSLSHVFSQEEIKKMHTSVVISKLKQSKISHSRLRHKPIHKKKKRHLKLNKENRLVILYDERERKRDSEEDRQQANEKGRE